MWEQWTSKTLAMLAFVVLSFLFCAFSACVHMCWRVPRTHAYVYLFACMRVHVCLWVYDGGSACMRGAYVHSCACECAWLCVCVCMVVRVHSCQILVPASLPHHQASRRWWHRTQPRGRTASARVPNCSGAKTQRTCVYTSAPSTPLRFLMWKRKKNKPPLKRGEGDRHFHMIET